jgi:hypothetical protein
MMLKKSLVLLAIAGIVSAVQPHSASAQLNLQLRLGQGAMICLGDNEGRAALQANQALPLAQILQRIGAVGQLISQQLCRVDGRFVWVISERNGGAVTQRVVDAATGQVIGQ